EGITYSKGTEINVTPTTAHGPHTTKNGCSVLVTSATHRPSTISNSPSRSWTPRVAAASDYGGPQSCRAERPISTRHDGAFRWVPRGVTSSTRRHIQFVYGIVASEVHPRMPRGVSALRGIARSDRRDGDSLRGDSRRLEEARSDDRRQRSLHRRTR